jgi:hypothetical protein
LLFPYKSISNVFPIQTTLPDVIPIQTIYMSFTIYTKSHCHVKKYFFRLLQPSRFFFRPGERSAAFYCIPTLLPIQQQQKIFPYINIRETPSPYINIRETTSPYINIRETPSPYIYIRETPSPYINIRKLPSPPALMLLRYNFRSFSIQ